MAAKLFRIAAVQMKFRQTLPENVEAICRFIAETAQVRSDVVLFPECALTGYNVNFRRIARPEIEAGLRTVAEAARFHRCNVLLGAPTFALRTQAIEDHQ